MKRFFYLGMFVLVAGILAFLSLEASAAPRVSRSSNSHSVPFQNNFKSAQTFTPAKSSGTTAIDPRITTKVGDLSSNTKKGGTVFNSPVTTKAGDLFPTKLKGVTNAGGGGGGKAKAGDVTATGGNGGNASGKGAQGGNGGDAIAVSGNGNTVINGNNNTVIGKVVNNNISLGLGGFGGGGFGGGFGGGGFGGGGGFDGGSFDSGFVTPGPVSGFNGDGPVVSNQAPTAPPATDPVGDEADRETVFTRRFLKIKNDSDETMKVFVQFRGQEDKKWSWTPADPNASQDAMVYDLKPGQEMYPEHKGKKISASRVRIWAVGEKSNWLDYRDQDLWIVPEMTQGGEHRYLSSEMRTFTLAFPKKTDSK